MRNPCPACTFENHTRRRKCEMCGCSLSAPSPSADPTGAITKSHRRSKRERSNSNSQTQLQSQSTSSLTECNALDAQPAVSEPASCKDAPMPMFATAGGTAIHVSKKALEDAEKKLAGMEDFNHSPSSSHHTNSAPNIPIMFSTAKGTPISVSPKALEEAKKKIASLEDKTAEWPSPNPRSDVPSSHRRPKRARSNSDSHSQLQSQSTSSLTENNAQPAVNDPASCNDAPMPTFATAGGTAIHVSKKALADAEKKLAGMDASSESATSPTVAPCLFATASGNAIKVSRKALEDAEKKLAGMEDFNRSPSSSHLTNPTSSDSIPFLFSTAKGTAISVSPKALDEAKKKIASLEDKSAIPAPAATAASPSPNPRCAMVPSSNASASSSMRRGFKAPSFAAPRAASTSETPTRALAMPSISTDRRPDSVKKSQALLGMASPNHALEVGKKNSTSLDSHGPGSLHKSASSTSASSSLTSLTLEMISSCEARCPLRKALPLTDAVLNGDYQFPAYLCCPQLRSLMSLHENATSVCSQNFADALVAMGAVRSGVRLEWVCHMLRSIMWKLLAYEMRRQDGECTLFSPLHVLVQLAYRYNREYVDGHRSILRRICEHDSVPTSLMVLCISSLTVPAASASPHQQIAEVTDGWYFVRCALDLPLTQLARDRLLSVGQKIMVWGATSASDTACNPLELSDTSLLLNLSFNGVRAAIPTAALGALPVKASITITMDSIHPNGGSVPCIAGVVTRVLPPFYVEKAVSAPPGGVSSTPIRGLHAPRVLRNTIAESKFAEQFTHQKIAAYEKAVQSMSPDDAALFMRDHFSRDLTEVSTIVLESECGQGAVAVQRMVRCGAHGAPESEEALPKEGKRIRLFSLTPAKMSQAPPPLNVKLLYARNTFMFIEDTATDAPARHDASAFRFERKTEHNLTVFSTWTQGRLADLVCVFIDTLPSPASSPATPAGAEARLPMGTRLLFCCLDKNVFAIMDVPTFPGSREITLSSPMSSTVCVVQNATFTSFDESGEHTVVRLQANEFTVITQRPSASGTQKLMSELKSQTALWKPNVVLAKTLLANPDSTSLLRPTTDTNHLKSVNDIKSYAVYDDHDSSGKSKSQPVGPYYLSSHGSSGTGGATQPTQLQHTPSGVKITPQSILTSRGSITRPLFDSMSTPNRDSRSHPSDKQRQLSVYSNHTGADRHQSTHGDGSPSPAAVCCPRHVFGNFTNNIVSILVDDKSTINVRKGYVCSLNATNTEDEEFCDLITSRSSVHLHFMLAFLSHLGEFSVRLSMPMVGVLFEQAALTPQQLSALATSDDYYHLAAGRSVALSKSLSEESTSGAWAALFLQSVVVPDLVIHQLLTTARNVAAAAGASKDECNAIEITPSVIAEHAKRLRRWNYEFVIIQDVVWWAESEWNDMIEQMMHSLSAKLFKATVSSHGDIEHLFFLKDRCNIEDLLVE